jgi:deoxyribodipyrimidine photo-lyase
LQLLMQTNSSQKVAVFWFRRDLRLEDNAGFSAALRSGYPVLPLFIFDRDILDRLEDRDDARVTFIRKVIAELRDELEKAGGTLLAPYGKPIEVFERLARQYPVAEVYTNHDYEVYAKDRDESIRRLLADRGIAFKTTKDQVIFERKEVLTGGGTVYTVFTPYAKKWKSLLTDADLVPHPCPLNSGNLCHMATPPVPSLEEMGFVPSALPLPGKDVSDDTLRGYAARRDYPAIEGTTRLGLHLRFGTVSVRRVVAKARALSDTWLTELIWREFYMQILDNFPHVEKHACKTAYDRIPFQHDEQAFRRWCEGNTGYPIVDAGMRQLNATGFMHNRVRMIAASFLVKHLLIDWRWGEAYFGRKLLDYDLASNNGSWQWVAGTGCDAAPYFRVFSPEAQAQKFDRRNEYIRRWVPELGTPAYPQPMIGHEFARDRVIRTYKEALAAARAG